MKAIRVQEFGGAEQLRLEDVPDPSAGPSQVVVRLHAAGVNPVDTYIRAGIHAIRPQLPYTPGSDGAGEIELVGTGVDTFKRGDRVYVASTNAGTYGEKVVCAAASVHPLPSNVSFAQGAALGVPYATAYRALFQRAHARPNETVLVHGASGGVGLAAVELAHARGLIVIGTGGTDEGRAVVREHGADAIFDHRAPDYTSGIMKATGGRGLDVIVEMLANVNLDRDLGLLAKGGRVVVVGNRGRIEINPRDAMNRDATILGMMLFNATATELAEIHAALRAGLENGTLRPVVRRELPLEHAGVSNGGPGTALGVTLKDPLPAGTTAAGWKLDSNSGSATCAIKGAVGSQELDCSAIDMAANTSYTVHVSAATSFEDCTEYDNKATASASNAPDATGSDSIQCNEPSLSVVKKADNASVNAGDPLGFTITVSNGGPGTAKGVTLADPLPAGTTATGWSIDSNSGSANCVINGAVGSQELDCSAVDLKSGASYVLHISAATSFADCTVYDNTATAHATNAPDATGEDKITCQKPSLLVVKKADQASVNAGDPLGFTITVSNGGPGAAKGVTLADPLPAGTTASGWKLDSNSGSANCAITGAVGSQELDCSAVDLAAGDSYQLHISAATSFAACTVYDNTATASASNAPDATGEDTITCSPAQVSISKTADHSAPVNAGDAIGFTVEVKNSGQGVATGVKLADPLPAGSGSGVTWAIDSSVGTPSKFVLAGAAGSQTLSLASGTLPAGADYKVHITAETSQTECGTYDNTATLTTANAGNPNPASAEESCVFHVDLAITKSGSPARQEGLGNITWTMVVTNNGPDTDTGVTISDPMPAGNTFVSAQSSQGTCTGGPILHCTIGTMTAGQKVTITLVTTPSAPGTQTNTAVVMGDKPETTLANNTATASVVIVAPHVIFCVAVSRITPGQLIVGRRTTVTIHLTQHGKAVKGVRVHIKGPKLDVTTKASNSKGIVKKVVKMKKKGILTFTPLAKNAPRCGNKRIGVRGVFTPPVTG